MTINGGITKPKQTASNAKNENNNKEKNKKKRQ